MNRPEIWMRNDLIPSDLILNKLGWLHTGVAFLFVPAQTNKIPGPGNGDGINLIEERYAKGYSYGTRLV
jgi:hypothetical protein